MTRSWNFFSKTNAAPAPDAPVLTRFQTSHELKGYAVELENMRKQYNITMKVADAKGAQCDAYHIAIILGAAIEKADGEIAKFNALPTPEDNNLNDQQMKELTDHLIPDKNQTIKAEATLNTLNASNEGPREARVAGYHLALLALPVAPLFIFGFGFLGVAAAIAGLLSLTPAESFLKSIKAIDEDKVSKTILENYINVLVKTNTNLGTYLVEHHQQQDLTPVEHVSSVRLA